MNPETKPKFNPFKPSLGVKDLLLDQIYILHDWYYKIGMFNPRSKVNYTYWLDLKSQVTQRIKRNGNTH